MNELKRLAVLGSTGSIGRQTLDVVKEHGEELAVYALAAARSVDLMEEQARAFQPALVVMMEEQAAVELRRRLKDTAVRVETGMAGMLEAVQAPEVDTVVSALSGRVGLEPTLAASPGARRLPWPIKRP